MSSSVSADIGLYVHVKDVFSYVCKFVGKNSNVHAMCMQCVCNVYAIVYALYMQCVCLRIRKHRKSLRTDRYMKRSLTGGYGYVNGHTETGQHDVVSGNLLLGLYVYGHRYGQKETPPFPAVRDLSPCEPYRTNTVLWATAV